MHLDVCVRKVRLATLRTATSPLILSCFECPSQPTEQDKDSSAVGFGRRGHSQWACGGDEAGVYQAIVLAWGYAID